MMCYMKVVVVVVFVEFGICRWLGFVGIVHFDVSSSVFIITTINLEIQTCYCVLCV